MKIEIQKHNKKICWGFYINLKKYWTIAPKIMHLKRKLLRNFEKKMCGGGVKILWTPLENFQIFKFGTFPNNKRKSSGWNKTELPWQSLCINSGYSNQFDFYLPTSNNLCYRFITLLLLYHIPWFYSIS